MSIKKIPFFKSIAKALFVTALCLPPLSFADPTFNAEDGELFIPRLNSDGVIYNNVLINLNFENNTFNLETLDPEHLIEVMVLLSGGQQVPPVSSTGSGFALIQLDSESGELQGGVITQNLVGATAAHIHEGVPGTNGGVVVALERDSLSGRFVIPSGTVLTNEKLAIFKEGGMYINVHTTANPGGELRGQLSLNSRESVKQLLSSDED